MFLGLTWLDWILVLVLLVFMSNGFRQGMWVSLGRMVGFVAGAAGAFFAIPWLSSLVPSPGWRVFATAAALFVLIGLGMLIGVALGRAVRLRVNLPLLRMVDRLLGAVLNTVIAALMIGVLAFSAGAVNLPQVTAAVSQSRVISTIHGVLPDRVQDWMAQARSGIAESGVLPELNLPVQEPMTPAEPSAAPPNADIEQAAESSVRITGTAWDCGQNQSGSGFAISPDRVITNAHVVAGVEQPTVETQANEAFTGEVVYFDSETDIAVLALDGANLEPLEVGDGLDVGESGYVLGYPSGGPYRVSPAEVQTSGPVMINNLYGDNAHLVDIYQLNADVQHGNSGGPLVDESGDVVGVIFAKADSDVTVGYALSEEEVGDVFASADDYDEAVSTESCLAD